MANPRKSWLMLLCLSTAAIFFAQTMWCYADQAGLVPCCEGTHSQHHHDPSNPHVPTAHDCCGGHSGGVITSDGRALVMQPIVVGFISAAEDSMPEPPVPAIDYPPQLS